MLFRSISDTDITDDFGTEALRWKDIYSASLRTGNTATDTLIVAGSDTVGGYTTFITVTANAPPTCAIAGATATTFTHTTGSIGTAVTAVTQDPSDNSTLVATTAYVDAAAGGGADFGAAIAPTSSYIDNNTYIYSPFLYDPVTDVIDPGEDFNFFIPFIANATDT